MGKPTGFLEYPCQFPQKRAVEERVRDFGELELPFERSLIVHQAARCMECGTPFCHDYTGCPLGNLIPDWNDAMYRSRLKDGLELLHKTNNFPEFTGRVCPAPCESACVLGLIDDPVTIKVIEKDIIESAFKEGLVVPLPPSRSTGKIIAVVGSGPCGLAAAQELRRFGHEVTVFERADRIGGLLRYGIPDFKLGKEVLDRRLGLMQEEGVEFRTGIHVGVDIPFENLQRDFNAVLLAIGATKPRDLLIEGRELKGVHFAMDYLTQQNKRLAGETIPEELLIDAKDKFVAIIGGGDTGADCLGTAIRQGAKKVYQLEILPEPPLTRDPSTPWPHWPYKLRKSDAHDEGGERIWSVQTKRFEGNPEGRVSGLTASKLEWFQEAPGGKPIFREVPGSDFYLDVDLVILAMGFLGPEDRLPSQVGLKKTPRGGIAADLWGMTNQEGIFVAGDAHRGASLVVWAIWEGRQAAKGVNQYLKKGETKARRRENPVVMLK